MRTISANRARELAYAWHGGQWSELYAFASSGLVENKTALLKDIERCAMLAGTKRDCRDVTSLHRFVQFRLAESGIAKYPLAAPWYRRAA